VPAWWVGGLVGWWVGRIRGWLGRGLIACGRGYEQGKEASHHMKLRCRSLALLGMTSAKVQSPPLVASLARGSARDDGLRFYRKP